MAGEGVHFIHDFITGKDYGGPLFPALWSRCTGRCTTPFPGGSGTPSHLRYTLVFRPSLCT